MAVTKVISGGQIGADIAGLRAAKSVGLQTGGWIPKGFRTLDGNKPEYANLYGLIETEYSDYPVRTKRNVRDSDGTVRFAVNFNTYGENCTLKELRMRHKPYFDVVITDDYMTAQPKFWDWLQQYNIKTLNVAGNAIFNIEWRVENYLMEVLQHEV